MLDLLRDDLVSVEGARERLERVRSQRETAERSRETAERALATSALGAARLDDSVARWRALLDRADWETRRELVEAVIPALPGYGVTIDRGEVEVVGALPISAENSGGGSVVMEDAPSGQHSCPQALDNALRALPTLTTGTATIFFEPSSGTEGLVAHPGGRATRKRPGNAGLERKVKR